MNSSDRLERPAGSEGEAVPLRGLPDSERTLLIVDDDPDVLEYASRVLGGGGYHVLTAPDWASALPVARPSTQ